MIAEQEHVAALPAIFAMALRLKEKALTFRPDADYHWVMGQAFAMRVFDAVVAIGTSKLTKCEIEQPDRPDFSNFCGSPGFIRVMEPTTCILVRDGVPYGAIHCEAL